MTFFCLLFFLQRTWSPTRPRWRSGTRRWGATSPSSLKPTTLPTKNCRRDTQRTWLKPWARCGSSTTEWLRRPPGAKTRVLLQTKTATEPCPCSDKSCPTGLTKNRSSPHIFSQLSCPFGVHYSTSITEGPFFYLFERRKSCCFCFDMQIRITQLSCLKKNVWLNHTIHARFLKTPPQRWV